jgi:glycosyltransferase involved in cell wall biosynthesis
VNRSLHVAIVAHDVGPVGGMESQLYRLAGGLLARGHRVTVVARSCELPAHPLLQFRRVRTPRRPFALGYPCFALLAAPRIPRDADVVHTTGALVAHRADVSTVHLLHAALRSRRVRRVRRDTLAYRFNAAAGAWMARAAERRCYRPGMTGTLVAVSAGVAREIGEHFPSMAERTAVIGNGVDTEVFRPDARLRAAMRERVGLRDDDLVAAFVGGDWPLKGLRFAVEALVDAPDWHLLVAGEGDADAQRSHAMQLGVSDRVHFLGTVRGAAAVHAAADAFVLPTAYETFSLVTYEAAACALPLLVTRVSGVEDVLSNGVNGWFVQRDAADIATRLRALAADPRRRAAMGAAARDAVQGVTWDAMVDAYEALYLRIAGHSATGAPSPAFGLATHPAFRPAPEATGAPHNTHIARETAGG